MNDVEDLQYPEIDTWTEYDETEYGEIDYEEAEYEGIEYENEIEITEEEMEKGEEETETESVDDTDILATYMTELGAKRAKELAAKAEEEKKRLHQLIAVT